MQNEFLCDSTMCDALSHTLFFFSLIRLKKDVSVSLSTRRNRTLSQWDIRLLVGWVASGRTAYMVMVDVNENEKLKLEEHFSSRFLSEVQQH